MAEMKKPNDHTELTKVERLKNKKTKNMYKYTDKYFKNSLQYVIYFVCSSSWQVQVQELSVQLSMRTTYLAIPEVLERCVL